MSVAENIGSIRERISRAAARAGRHDADITLMAVSKTQPVEKIVKAYNAGVRLFGENRVQEFAEKKPALAPLKDASFHLIGHLQSNKARRSVELFASIDSVDSLRLAERINATAAELSKTVDVLVEVNIGGEAAKSGLAPDSPEFDRILVAASRLEHLRICGLMTIPPHTEDPEGARPYFKQMRSLRDRIAARKLPCISMDSLSMGMSHDFEVAIEEGSTCIRIGTAIFGERGNQIR